MHIQVVARLGRVSLLLGLPSLLLALLVGCGTSAPAPSTREELCTTAVPEGCEPCFWDVECGAGHQCRQGICSAAAACDTASDCPDEFPACSKAGACSECATDKDCGGSGVCAGGECAPSCEKQDDCSSGQICDEALGVCVQCSSDGDCPESLSCQSNRCVADRCEPGAARCDANVNAVWSCAESGGKEEVFLCPDGKFCEEDGKGKAECAPQICAPGSAVCEVDGVTLSTCSSSGLTASKVDCSKEGGACLNGACVELICKPGERSCSDATLVECSPNGTELFPIDTCDTSEYCDTKKKSCQPDTCEAGTALCDGNIATTCAADGAGPLEGTDCSKDDQQCFAGECRDVICEGEFVCDAGDVFTCGDSGTRLVLNDHCTGSEFCSPGVSTCQPMQCSPSQKYCDQNVAKTCKSDGSEPVDAGTDCGDELCVSGTCKPVVCTAGEITCVNNTIYDCNFNGTVEIVTVCDETQYCRDGNPQCNEDICRPGYDGCDNYRSVQVCSDDGGDITFSYCEGNEFCIGLGDVACGPPGDCSPLGFSCEGQNVKYCSEYAALITVKTCADNQYCTGDGTLCADRVCEPNVSSCSGNRIMTCNANGSQLTDSGVVCSGTQVCLDGACVEAAQ